MRIFVNYKQGVSPDHEFACDVEKALCADDHRVFRDETGLVPSEKWPARLEQEVRACDAMVSIVSNAALKSKWVLNEVDLAIELEKRIVPLILEEIDPSLQFQAFRPRFTGTQCMTATADRESDLKALVTVLRETRHQCYQDLICAQLSEHGLTDAGEMLEALCGVLYQSHWPAYFLEQTVITDELRVAGRRTPLSLADVLLNHVISWSQMTAHNAQTWRKSGEDARSKRLTWQSQRLSCLADVLRSMIDAWDRNLARRTVVDSQQDRPLHVFDDTDGETVFASEYADPLMKRTVPVPVGSVARIYVRQPSEEAQTLATSSDVPETRDAEVDSKA